MRQITLRIVFASVFVSLLFSVSTSAYSTAQINDLIEGGTPQAAGYDSYCRTNLINNRDAPSTTLRHGINGDFGQLGASYIENTWLSSASTGNTATPTPVSWRQTAVPLRMNSLKFLCGPLVAPDDLYPGSTNVAAGASNDRVAADSRRWVTTGNANDRPPNAIGSTNMKPAATSSQTRIDGFTVVSATQNGVPVAPGSISVPGGCARPERCGILSVTRNENSRYWLAPPVPVTYNSGVPITGNMQITIDMYYRTIAGYHRPINNNGWRQICDTPSGRVSRDYPSIVGFDECNQFVSRLTILFRPTMIYNYQLTPEVTLNETHIEPGQQLSPTYNINKTGTSWSLPGTAVAVKDFIVPPGGSIGRSGVTDGPPNRTDCDGINQVRDASNNNICAITRWSRGGYEFRGSPNNPISDPAIPPITTRHPITNQELAVGTQICRVLAVDPWDAFDGRHRWSVLKCVRVAKSPYVTIKNGDVWSGGSFRTAVNAPCAIGDGEIRGNSGIYENGRTYGSYSEYGAFALGRVTTFGSAGKPATSNNLIFKRPSGSGLGGEFYTSTANPSTSLTSHCLQDADDHYQMSGGRNSDLTIGPSFTIGTNTNGKFYSPGPTLTINSGSVGNPGGPRRVVVYVNGNVTINGNIAVANPTGDITTLNSFVLIATGDIYVNGNVTQLDGYYQAKGTFYTCPEANDTIRHPTGVAVTECRNPLTINGALNVGALRLQRTAGNADTASRNQPAEQIIMRPDVFLGLYAGASGNGQIRTVNETELPPRF